MRLMGLKTGLSQSVHNAAAQKRRAMEAGIGFAGPAVTGRVKWTKTGAKQMMKVILAQVQQYKAPTLLAPLFTVFEVLMEVLIPFVTASIIDKGIEAGNIRQVYFYGGIMLAMALLSLVFGVLAGRYAAKASSGLACNLRESIYEKVQTFSFSNIDKFSTAGLVTRMTTDVTNVQNAAQMILRVAVRAPLMLVCSMVMCFFISARLSMIFLAAILVLAAALISIMVRTTKVFNEVFRKYDDLNASVQENVSAIRVVKAIVREEYENSKFERSAGKLYTLFVKAESNLALNNPVMMLVVYGCILAISWFGARFIVAGSLTTGNLTSLFSYVMSVLMSLMMLSMVFVMITMSAASGRRIAEVLNEEPDMNGSDRPETEVRDGRIDFTWIEQGGNNVSGGQKQRLCIARALLKKPKVLILDDSTSAVDTATDAKIREAFAKKIPGTTKLIVAQRISSVQEADRILVLDNGTVNGFDTHENLLQTNKIYREIYEAQSKGGGDFDQPARNGKEGVS